MPNPPCGSFWRQSAVNENRPQQTGVENLLAQDTQVSTFQFEEFRMNLEASIQDLQQRAHTVRRASHWGLGIFVTCVLLTPVLEVFGLFDHVWARRVWSGCGVLAMLATGVLAAIYTYRFQPALKRARSDLQSAEITQLQQQVAELSRQLDSQ